MKKLTTILFSLMILGCSFNKQEENGQFNFKITLIESYNIIETYSLFEEVNKNLKKEIKDSIKEIKTGLALLDQMNQDTSIQSNDPFDEFPLFRIFSPNIKTTNNQQYLDTSSILGFIKVIDTSKFVEIFKKSINREIFPSDFELDLLTSFDENLLFVHGFKKESKPVQIFNNGYAQLFAEESYGIYEVFSPAMKKVHTIGKEPGYSIKFKFNDSFIENNMSKTFTMIIECNEKKYSMSITDLNKMDTIYLCTIDKVNIELLKEKYGDVLQINE